MSQQKKSFFTAHNEIRFIASVSLHRKCIFRLIATVHAGFRYRFLYELDIAMSLQSSGH